ncbi:unnamed protein product [Prunus brigantina]
MSPCNIATSCFESVSTSILVNLASKPAATAARTASASATRAERHEKPHTPPASSIQPLLSRATQPAPPLKVACAQAPSQLIFIHPSTGFCQVWAPLRSHSGGLGWSCISGLLTGPAATNSTICFWQVRATSCGGACCPWKISAFLFFHSLHSPIANHCKIS